MGAVCCSLEPSKTVPKGQLRAMVADLGLDTDEGLREARQRRARRKRSLATTLNTTTSTSSAHGISTSQLQPDLLLHQSRSSMLSPTNLLAPQEKNASFTAGGGDANGRSTSIASSRISRAASPPPMLVMRKHSSGTVGRPIGMISSRRADGVTMPPNPQSSGALVETNSGLSQQGYGGSTTLRGLLPGLTMAMDDESRRRSSSLLQAHHQQYNNNTRINKNSTFISMSPPTIGGGRLEATNKGVSGHHYQNTLFNPTHGQRIASSRENITRQLSSSAAQRAHSPTALPTLMNVTLVDGGGGSASLSSPRRIHPDHTNSHQASHSSNSHHHVNAMSYTDSDGGELGRLRRVTSHNHHHDNKTMGDTIRSSMLSGGGGQSGVGNKHGDDDHRRQFSISAVSTTSGGIAVSPRRDNNNNGFAAVHPTPFLMSSAHHTIPPPRGSIDTLCPATTSTVRLVSASLPPSSPRADAVTSNSRNPLVVVERPH